MPAKLRNIFAVAGLIVCGLAPLAAGKYFHPWDGSREVPVHRIPLTDDDGQSIVPQDPNATPFSTRATCGICHDYEAISGGWHFNAGNKNVPDGRPGEPWVWVDETTGTQIPISNRNWPGLWKPQQVGLTPWKFTKLFGRHMPGGGPGEPSNTLDDADARWDVSGKLEVNCLACHNASPKQDMTEWVKQVARENFRWAATAASGMGEVGGMASRIRESWAPYDGPNLDDKQFAVAPFIRYDQQYFNSKGNAFFDIPARPLDNRCEHCHSVAPVGMKRIEVDTDVHTAAGLKCVDCHNNDIKHQIDRGVGGDHTCRGCHLVEGQYRAPKPEHKGLPPHHFEKLTCTVCHSGPLPDEQPTVVKTSRANRLGIFGKAEWDTTLPHIVEPVFVQNEEGKIEPRRMMWPSYWVRVLNGQVEPIPPEEVQKVSTGIFDAAQQVACVLNGLQNAVNADGEAVYPGTVGFVAGGKVLQVNADKGLDVVGSGSQLRDGWVVQTNDQWSSATQLSFDAGKFIPVKGMSDDDVKDKKIAVGVLASLKAYAPAGVTPVVVKDGKVMECDKNDELVESEKQPALTGQVWAWLKDGRLEPLVTDFAMRTVKELVGTDRMLTEEQVTLILKKLGDKAGFIGNGKMFRLGSDGKLTASVHPAAAPVSWAMGHDVRPAMQSLGAKSCGDCHSENSPFFFAQIKAMGPLKTSQETVTPMYEFEKQEANYNRLFGLSFTIRPFFKLVLLVAAGLTAAVLLLYVMLALGRLTELRRIWRLETVSLVLTSASGIGLGIVGLMETMFLGKPLAGYPVLIHMTLVGVFAVSLALLVILRAREHSFHPVETPVVSLMQRIFFWALIISGLVLVVTILAAMVPVLGGSGQRLCLLLHRNSSIVVIVATLCYGILAVRARKSQP